MDEERQQIMEMLAAGTITAEEADQLLEAIAAEPPASTGPTQRIDSQQRDATANQPTNVFANLSLDQLIHARRQGVDPDFAREMRDAGFGELPLDQLIHARQQGVDPDFAREMRDAGFGDLSLDKLIELRQQGVDPDFIRQMRAVGR